MQFIIRLHERIKGEDYRTPIPAVQGQGEAQGQWVANVWEIKRRGYEMQVKFDIVLQI